MVRLPRHLGAQGQGLTVEVSRRSALLLLGVAPIAAMIAVKGALVAPPHAVALVRRNLGIVTLPDGAKMIELTEWTVLMSDGTEREEFAPAGVGTLPCLPIIDGEPRQLS
jgi:hypothetical protein